MSDLEQRLADALAEEAHVAPSAVGLAAAARSRARRRRRTHVAGAAALVALAIGVPAGLLAHDDGPHPSPGPAGDGRAMDPVEGDGDVPDGYRVESWHGVTIQVPDTWEYGAMTQWCVGKGSPDTPLIDWPGIQTQVLCTPASSYGVSFSPADGRNVQWPVAPQHSDAWPNGAYVGATTVDNVVVTVAAPDAAVTAAVLGSARKIGPGGDPNGCAATRDAAGRDVAEGIVVTCRYDEQGLLEQSAVITGDDAQAAVAALEAAPAYTSDCGSASSEVFSVVRLRTADLDASVDLGGGCAAMHGLDGGDRELTNDVLYWALSPGWSGAVDANIPLPSELRQR